MNRTQRLVKGDRRLTVSAVIVLIAALTLLGFGLAAGGGRPASAPPTRPAATSLPPHSNTPTAPPASSDDPTARSVPQRIRIPAIGVDGPVMSVGLQADGTLEVPPIEANAPAGWYDGSPTPGQPGPSVIVGHVTVGSYGHGIFFRLAEVNAGDQIFVQRADGTTATFVATKVEQYPKSKFPTTAVYGNTSDAELRLVTCAGPRDPSSGYQDSLVVFATLVSRR